MVLWLAWLNLVGLPYRFLQLRGHRTLNVRNNKQQQQHGSINVRPSFPIPIIGTVDNMRFKEGMHSENILSVEALFKKKKFPNSQKGIIARRIFVAFYLRVTCSKHIGIERSSECSS